MNRKPQKKRTTAGRKKTGANAKLLYLALIGVLAGALVFIVGYGGAGSNPAPEVIPGGSLTATENYYDFGRVSMKNGVVTYPFRLRNSGSEPALIRKLYTS